jgi:ABC-type polysaccharide/polyol phosphate export permease
MSLLIAEIARHVNTTKRYKWDRLAELVQYAVMFAVFYLAIRDDGHLVARIIGFAMWQVASAVLYEMGTSIDAEIGNGTLPQIALTSSGILRTLTARTVAVVIVELGLSAALGVACVVTSAAVLGTATLSISHAALTALAFAVALLGIVGIGMVVSGLSMLIRGFSSVLNLIQYGMFFFGGTFTDILSLPMPFRAVGLAFPTTWANMIAQSAVPSSQLYAGLVGGSIAHIILGRVLFGAMERRARKAGLLFRE